MNYTRLQSLFSVLPGILAIIKRFWPQLRVHKKMLAASFISLLLAISARVIEPWPLMLVFDSILMPAETAKSPLDISPIIGGEIMKNPALLLVLLAIIFVIITASRAMFTYLSATGMAIVASRVTGDIRQLLFSHLQRLSLKFHQKSKSGDLITRFTYDIDRLRDATSLALLPFIANMITVFTMLAVMFWFNAQLALIVLLVTPFFFLSSLKFSNTIQQAVRRQRRRDGALAATAAESVVAIKLVQALSLNNMLEKSFNRISGKSMRKGALSQRLSARLERNVELLLAMATALVIWRGGHLVLSGVISVGTLLVFISYLALVFRPMRQSAKYLITLSKALASGERILDILDTAPEVTDAEHAIEAGNISGTIEFRNVDFAYDKNTALFRKFNLTVAPGEHIALVGPSGGGKSTLLSLLLRLYEPTKGKILLDGNDIKRIKLTSLRSQFGLVLQDPSLFGVSIKDNIGYGRLDADINTIVNAAKLANAHDFIMALSKGYDTVIGERGCTLSGGQIQRIALARAVVRDAPILLLDEPSTALDRVNEREVIAALKKCMRGKTTILVSHNLQIAKHFDQIYFIESGAITESGTHKELLNACGKYWQLYCRQRPDSNQHTANIELADCSASVTSSLR